jgi:cyclophilin family peptidyl-prolyl cis-trans isomerase
MYCAAMSGNVPGHEVVAGSVWNFAARTARSSVARRSFDTVPVCSGAGPVAVTRPPAVIAIEKGRMLPPVRPKANPVCASAVTTASRAIAGSVARPLPYGSMRRALPIVALVAALAGCGGGGSAGSSSNAPPKALLSPDKLTQKAPQRFDCVFHTTAGDFTIRVQRAWAPHGADRFYNLCRNHFYDGAKIFRVVPGFVAQFGISAYPEVSQAWEQATIPDDPVVKQNTRGAVSFAAAGPSSRTTQVFINLGSNLQLDSEQFAPFGAVTKGMSVVDKLYSGYGDRPTGDQQQMFSQGNAYLDKQWPKLTAIVSTKLALP